jgi:hypothetical protein
VPVEPVPAVSPPVTSPGEKTTLRVYPVTSSTVSNFLGENAIAIGNATAEAAAFDPYIHEPR